MRPEMGRVQAAQLAVGVEVGSQGREGRGRVGVDCVCWGRGLGAGAWEGVVMVGSAVMDGGSGWSSGPSKENVGTPGADGSGSPIGGSYGSSSSGRLMVGIAGAPLSGRLIVGTIGADTVTAGGSGRGRTGNSLSPFLTSDGDFHAESKLTIGLPARSLTAVGVGSLGLRSLRFILVAARMSSLRISFPSFVGVFSGSMMIGVGVALLVYGAAFGCSACLRRLSNGFGRVLGMVGIVSAFCGSGLGLCDIVLVDMECNAFVSGTILTSVSVFTILFGSSNILSSGFGNVVDLLLVLL